ncbi:hypothetical protein ACP70R_047113 [Stipagrostis hirtigluma subsp. patula]
MEVEIGDTRSSVSTFARQLTDELIFNLPTTTISSVFSIPQPEPRRR